MSLKELIDQSLNDIRPILAAAGRSVSVDQADASVCTISLKGFCDGCACSESYKEGIEELIREKAPEIQHVTFVQVS